MLNLTVDVALEKRFLPFLKSGSEIKMKIDPFSSPKQAVVQIELKDGLSSDMIEAFGKLNFSLDFDSVKQSEQEEEFVQERTPERAPERKPALPQVTNEYDEVKDIIGSDLGDPIQTLFSQKQLVNKKNLSNNGLKKQAFVVPDPDPIPEKAPVSENNAMNDMMKQMQLMMQQMQAMKNGGQVPNQIVEEQEEEIDSIMTAKEFFEVLAKTGNDIPNIDFNKKLSKQEAVELEKYKINKPAYVVSSKGLLFIDDVGISVKQGLACNLSSIPIFKLKRSNDLIRCLKNGMLTFIKYTTAKKLSEKADLTSATEGVDSKLRTFLGENGDGVENAFRSPIDVTPGLADDSPSERMLQPNHRGRPQDGIIVDEVYESDVDEQSDLINLSGGEMEDFSEASKSSFRDRQAATSKTWKPSTRLDD